MIQTLSFIYRFIYLYIYLFTDTLQLGKICRSGTVSTEIPEGCFFFFCCCSCKKAGKSSPLWYSGSGAIQPYLLLLFGCRPLQSEARVSLPSCVPQGYCLSASLGLGAELALHRTGTARPAHTGSCLRARRGPAFPVPVPQAARGLLAVSSSRREGSGRGGGRAAGNGPWAVVPRPLRR